MGGTGFYLNTLLSSEPTAPASTADDKQYAEQLIGSKSWDQRYGIWRIMKFHREHVVYGQFRITTIM